MDVDIPPESIHEEVPCIHSISELSTDPRNETLWMKVLNEYKVPILLVCVNLTGGAFSKLILQDLGMDLPSFHIVA